MMLGPREFPPPLCISDCVLCLCANRGTSRSPATARRPGGGRASCRHPDRFVLLADRDGGESCPARCIDTRGGNLGRQRHRFPAWARTAAADGAIPWREPLAPSHQLPEIKKAPLAPAKSASARQSRHGKWREWRTPSARSLVPFQRKLSAIDRHLCFAAGSFFFFSPFLGRWFVFF